jgi:uncharacterized Ntn-hydrolase superfamily protein
MLNGEELWGDNQFVQVRVDKLEDEVELIKSVLVIYKKEFDENKRLECKTLCDNMYWKYLA